MSGESVTAATWMKTMRHWKWQMRGSRGTSCGPSVWYLHSRRSQKEELCLLLQEVRVLWRHMKTCHPDEDEVRELMKVDDTSEKAKKISLLWYRGNFEHNKRVKGNDPGELGGEMTISTKHIDFLPCPHGLQYALRSGIKRHRVKNCLDSVSRGWGSSDEEGTKRIAFDSILITNEMGNVTKRCL